MGVARRVVARVGLDEPHPLWHAEARDAGGVSLHVEPSTVGLISDALLGDNRPIKSSTRSSMDSDVLQKGSDAPAECGAQAK